MNASDLLNHTKQQISESEYLTISITTDIIEIESQFVKDNFIHVYAKDLNDTYDLYKIDEIEYSRDNENCSIVAGNFYLTLREECYKLFDALNINLITINDGYRVIGKLLNNSLSGILPIELPDERYFVEYFYDNEKHLHHMCIQVRDFLFKIMINCEEFDIKENFK